MSHKEFFFISWVSALLINIIWHLLPPFYLILYLNVWIWIRIRIPNTDPDPDPGSSWVRIQSGSGSTTLADTQFLPDDLINEELRIGKNGFANFFFSFSQRYLIANFSLHTEVFIYLNYCYWVCKHTQVRMYLLPLLFL